MDDNPVGSSDFHGLAVRSGGQFMPRPKIKCPKWGIDVVRANTAEVERYGSGEYSAWYNLVKPCGQWDFKAHPKEHPGVSDADLDYTGNFNYAATGALLQIPENVLLAAGAFWLHGFNIDLCPKKKRRRC